jgi:hypothetical protein
MVKTRTRFRTLAGTALPFVLVWAGTSGAQETPAPNPPAQSVAAQDGTLNIVALPCVQPQPMVRLQDYNGPLQKTVGLFTLQLERKAVHPIHYKPGLKLCSIELKDKFLLFVRGSFDPATFLSTGFNAGISQAENQDGAFRQGTAGYAKRFGASYADQATFRFFKDFLYPSIFNEDPRYYRLARASGNKRFLHAIEHVVVAHTDNGNRMFNFSEWLGTVSAISLSNVYHPGNKRGFRSSAEGLGISLLTDMGYDVLREFWPEISRKFKLPFRAEPEPATEEIDLNPPIN